MERNYDDEKFDYEISGNRHPLSLYIFSGSNDRDERKPSKKCKSKSSLPNLEKDGKN